MPRIAPYNYQTEAPGAIPASQASGEALGASAAALSNLGNRVNQTAGRLADIENQRSIWDAELTAAEAENRWSARLKAEQEAAPEGAQGFTQRIQDDFETWKSDALDTATSAAARQLLETKFTRLGGQVVEQAGRFEATSFAAQQTQRLETSLSQNKNRVRANPAQLIDVEKKSKELIDSTPFWDNQTKTKMWAKYREGLYDSGLDGLITTYETTPMAVENIDGLMQGLKDDWLGFRSSTSPEMFDAALTRLEKRKASIDAEGKANVSLYLQDTLTSIAIHGTDPGLLTPESIRTAFKDDPEKANRVIKVIQDAKNYYNVRQSVALTTPEEDVRNLAALKNKAYGVGATQGAEFMSDYQRALNAKYQAINTDPFTYVVQNTPSLAQDLQDAANDPERFREALAKSNELQGRLGVPEWRRGVLGQGAAQQTAQRLNAVPPEQAADELEGLARQYGPLWGNAMRELADAKLNPAFMTLARLDGPQDVAVRKNLATALQTGRDTLRKNISVPIANAVDEKVMDKMTDFARTVSYDGTTGQQVMAAETASAQALAYLYVQRGLSESDAAKRAVNDLLGDRYDFTDSYRTPKGMSSRVDGLAREIQRKLTPEQFAPVTGGDPALGVEYRQRVAWSMAVNNGLWLNTPDGKGIQLYVPDDNSGMGYSPAKLKTGEPVIVNFDSAQNWTPPNGNPRQVR